MADSRTHTLHHGERAVQQRRHTPDELARSIPNYIQTDMPRQLEEFYTNLSYLPLATMDGEGRPWVSMLVTRSSVDSAIGVRIERANELSLRALAHAQDPFVRAVAHARQARAEALFAGVGVDFTNRRRNKLAGSIHSSSVDGEGRLHLELRSNEHLGNCPKYITVRSLVPHPRTPTLALDCMDGLTKPLPPSCKAVIARASTVFLATKHVPSDPQRSDDQADMGLNHRGGSPGFVRLYESTERTAKPAGENGPDEEVQTYLVLPDYSGNRFYQSLGNIESNKQVGLAFPDFETGDVLYVTGEAQNLFDADAEALMPRTTLLTRIRVTGAVFIEQALSLRLASEEELSPYNPPVRYLREELESMGRAQGTDIAVERANTATLLSVQTLSSTVRTFSFQLAKAVAPPPPGGFGVFDFSAMLDTGYRHMNELRPQALNDDYIRTWTLSSAPDFDHETGRFRPTDTLAITVKRQAKGLVSGFLHGPEGKAKLQVPLRGVGGEFSCFDLSNAESLVPEAMLWVAGGVGVTPFMSMWDGIRKTHAANQGSRVRTDIVLVFAGRDDDLNLLRHFLEDAVAMQPYVSLRVLAYQSAGAARAEAEAARTSIVRDFPEAALTVHERRLDPADLAQVPALKSRDVFLCGPDALMNTSENWLKSNGVDGAKIHRESYSF